jgi:rubrerythrin
MRTRTTPQHDTRRPERRSAHPVRRGAARTGEDRVRDAGGPQDLAFYRCDCGYSFSGDVSTRVACPHCGTDQAW